MISKSNSLIYSLLIICLAIEISSTLLEVTNKKDYCFYKDLTEPDTIRFTYIISSEKSEKVQIIFNQTSPQKNLYLENEAQNGEYKSDILLPGEYVLCFISQESNNFYITFEFYSFIENGIVKELAHDQEVKQMSEGVNELKNSFQNFEKNFKFIVDRRSRHSKILNDIISSIKKLTFLKLGIIVILSVFQVIVIQRFFGPDKRVTSVKGAFSDGL